jgi:hypothetical protein
VAIERAPDQHLPKLVISCGIARAAIGSPDEQYFPRRQMTAARTATLSEVVEIMHLAGLNEGAGPSPPNGRVYQ